MSDPTTPADPPSQSVTPWYADKALYVMVLAVILPFFSKLLGIPLDAEHVAAFIIPIITFIVAHKVKSATVLLAEIKAKAAAAVGPDPTDAAGAAAALNALTAAPGAK